MCCAGLRVRSVSESAAGGAAWRLLSCDLSAAASSAGSPPARARAAKVSSMLRPIKACSPASGSPAVQHNKTGPLHAALRCAGNGPAQPLHPSPASEILQSL